MIFKGYLSNYLSICIAIYRVICESINKPKECLRGRRHRCGLSAAYQRDSWFSLSEGQLAQPIRGTAGSAVGSVSMFPHRDVGIQINETYSLLYLGKSVSIIESYTVLRNIYRYMNTFPKVTPAMFQTKTIAGDFMT